MSRANEFLAVFSKLETEIKTRASRLPQLVSYRADQQRNKLKTYVGSLDLLEEYGKDRVVVEHISKLRLYGQLRNALSHNYNDEPIAEPRPDTVSSINSLYNAILQPKTAVNIMTPRPTTFKTNEDLYDSLTIMDTKGFTSVPIYDNDKLVGVLSERSTLRWAADMRDESIKLAEPKVLKDIVQYLDKVDNVDFDIYYFVSKKLDVFSIRDMFNGAIRRGKRVSAVFVTENGKESEALLGIITAWDLYRID